MPLESPCALGPFRLRVDPARAAAYARETGGDVETVPLAYPAIWLAEPSLFSVVRDLCDDLDVVPVHESQSFSYDAPLVAGESYDFSVTISREDTPPRLTLVAMVARLDGEPCARVETMMRLVPRAALASVS
ncbi:hypothetical protein [Methylocystis sp. B8]|uniref:hypothetical protein n=1 Tax=Methylocystis sp. B8 TaxID=544938 RepID=UPI0010FD50B4|nr:hypothetical protein [Methylocystis sp. B8]TLG78852.1 hypothetical protein FEV16_02120 [Methylocystis sp. B8]